jgi:hypothetical protein
MGRKDVRRFFCLRRPSGHPDVVLEVGPSAFLHDDERGRTHGSDLACLDPARDPSRARGRCLVCLARLSVWKVPARRPRVLCLRRRPFPSDRRPGPRQDSTRVAFTPTWWHQSRSAQPPGWILPRLKDHSTACRWACIASLFLPGTPLLEFGW